MTIGEFLAALQQEIPLAAAIEKDPVGLHVGDPRRKLRGILVAHDVDVSTVAKAVRIGANLIVCYHPVIFSPLRHLDPLDSPAHIPVALTQQRIAAFAVHTAFDTHPEGTNMLFANAIGMKKVKPLVPLVGQSCKITVYVPSHAVDVVAVTMWNAGGGRIGDYGECSFRTEGTGTFRGGVSTHPTTGVRGRRESVNEIRLEIVCPSWKLTAVLTAMHRAHPYEEIAYDVVTLRNDLTGRGMGAIGEIDRAISLAAFIKHLKRTCGAAMVRTNGSLRSSVRRIAIVGGSGASMLDDAVREGADVLITGDVRYHTFRHAQRRIAVIDAGHRETERFVTAGIAVIIRRLFRSLKISHIRVVREQMSTNPILYV